MILKLYIYAAILLNFTSGYVAKPGINENKKITVIGIAENEKDVATVVTPKNGFYIIDHLNQWSNKYYHKKVKVTGWLKIEYHTRQSTDSMEVQERVGNWRVIKHATWTLVYK